MKNLFMLTVRNCSPKVEIELKATLKTKGKYCQKLVVETKSKQNTNLCFPSKQLECGSLRRLLTTARNTFFDNQIHFYENFLFLNW